MYMYSCLYQLLVMLVLGICVCNINASSLFFQVRHSQRANCPLLSTWVLCEDGTIESAHCTCMAGLCEACSHVGAILFYLESAVRVRKTCTQLDCAWKSPRFVETIPYARIADIPFTKPKTRISCNKRRGAHLYSDDIPDSELPEPRLEERIDDEPESSERQQPEAWSRVLNTAPATEEQSEFLSKISSLNPVICSIVPPFSDAFKPASVISYI